jgi:hypothetical protein
VIEMRKVLLTGLFLFFAVYGVTKADAVDDAAKLVYDGEVTTTEISKIFSASEMKKVNEKVKELKLEELKEKKGREEEKKENKLLNIIRSKKNKEKDNILVEDIDKELTRVETRVTKLETRVTKLETSKQNVQKSNTVQKTENATTKKKMTIQEASELVIQGKVGDGEERVEKLKKLGFSKKEIEIIQKSVNKIMQ